MKSKLFSKVLTFVLAFTMCIGNFSLDVFASENYLTTEETIKMVDIFVTSPEPTEERRIRRINKIMQIESGEYVEL